MIVVGIDPGKTGAIAYLTPKVEALVMPEISDFAQFIWQLAQPMRAENLHVYIEKCQSMPKQGVASSFSYGRHFGELLGVLVAYRIAHTLVPPKTWTRVMHAGTALSSAKERSLEACRRLFPDYNLLATPRSTVPHTGLVDALLIAEYGRRDLAQ